MFNKKRISNNRPTTNSFSNKKSGDVRSRIKRKKLLKSVGRGVAIAAIASTPFLAELQLRKNRARKDKASLVLDAQKAGVRRRLSKSFDAKLKADEKRLKEINNNIKRAIERGMIPKYYKGYIVEYVDPPSVKGVKRSKPVKTIYGEQLEAKKK
jgi:hypothetical protein